MPKVAIGGVADLPLFGVCLRGACDNVASSSHHVGSVSEVLGARSQILHNAPRLGASL